MFVAWGVLAPMAILIARFFKVLPRQDWPRQLDSQCWWRVHWMGQSAVLLLTVLAVCLLYRAGTDTTGLHSRFGYCVLALLLFQVALGYFRGSKGGPTAPRYDGALSGDHYDMNLRRRVFEFLHKTLGYFLMLLSVVTIALGLWHVNSPRWMWICIVGWWLLLIAAFIAMQRKGCAIDTYQAIWGPDLKHPGNRKAAAGWGMRRIAPGREPR